MIQVVGGDFDIVDIEGAFNEVVIANLGPALIERDGKIGIPHLSGQGFTQGLAKVLRAVYVPFVTRHKKRSEEWDALDMIPMRMANQDVAAQAFSAGRHQILTYRLSPRSPINNNNCSSCRPALDTPAVSS